MSMMILSSSITHFFIKIKKIKRNTIKKTTTYLLFQNSKVYHKKNLKFPDINQGKIKFIIDNYVFSTTLINFCRKKLGRAKALR